MNISLSAWFWLLVIAIIGFIVFFILNEIQVVDQIWIWVIFVISLIFLLTAFILYIIALKDYNSCKTKACEFTVLS